MTAHALSQVQVKLAQQILHPILQAENAAPQPKDPARQSVFGAGTDDIW